MQRGSERDRTFWWIAGTEIVAKLWLTSFIAIGARLAPYDNGNFLEHAKFVLAGAWLGPYDERTLIKGPGTELYLALVRELGISLPLAHQCLYLLAALAVCRAIAPVVRGALPRALVFTTLAFDPFTFSANAWALNRSQLTDSLALFFVASAIGAIVRAASLRLRVPALSLGAFGLALSALWITREDTLWTIPPLVLFLGAYLWRVRATDARGRRVRVALAALPVAILVVTVQTLATINGAVYGWRTTVETTSPEFVSAYQAMARVVVPGVADNRTFPAPRAARAMAARVSPAAADIVSHFDLTGEFQKASCSTLGLCDDVSAGWFVWAMREAAAKAGHYETGAGARAFYLRLAREVDAACAGGRLTCRAKSFSLAPPMHPSDVPTIAGYAAEAFSHAVSFDQVGLGAAGRMSAADESVASDYANVTGSAGSRTTTYRGWLVRPRGASMRLAGRYATDFLSVDFEPSPDVERRLARSPAYARDDLHRARFVLSTSCVTDCALLIGNGASGIVRIPLDPNTTDFTAPGFAYHLDFSSREPIAYVTGALKAAVLGFILDAYGVAIPISVVAAASLVALRLLRLARFRWKRRPPAYLVLVAGVTVAAGAQCAMLGVVSAISFYAIYPEYEAALYPLVLLIPALIAAAEVPVVVRASRARRAQRSERTAIVTNSL